MNELLEVTNLTKSFQLHAGLFAQADQRVYALGGVDLTLRTGETYGLVGESGSGKTTLARTLVQLEAHERGTIRYLSSDGSAWEVRRGDRRNLERYRQEVRYVFQDPSSSLDPRMTVGDLLTIGARQRTRGKDRAGLVARAREGLDHVGLRASDWDRRPSEFSGGQRQRIALARALVTRPRLLICDEVVSALDVSVRGQILELLLDLKNRFGLSMVFIAHDLDVVAYMADRVGVLYGGRMMEEAPSRLLVEKPLHPYTKLLFDSAPGAGIRSRETSAQKLTPTRALTGCPFAPRCPLVIDRCRTEIPLPRAVGPQSGRLVACHRVEAE